MHPDLTPANRTVQGQFCPGSWLDTRGVLLSEPDPGHVLRALTAEGEEVLRHIQSGAGLQPLVERGLIETAVADNSRPAGLSDCFKTVLRHRRIPRVIVPAEWTLAMWQEALAAFCDFNLGLIDAGLCLEDAHPNNLLFDADGRVRFVDFGSLKIQRKRFGISRGWHREFKRAFLLPLVLDRARLRPLARLARRETRDGILRNYYQLTPLRALMAPFDLIYFASKALGSERAYFTRIQSVLCRRPTGVQQTHWTEYESGRENLKTRVVPELIGQLAGVDSVLDLAGNKGDHIRQAARAGKLATLADIDEFSLDCARTAGRGESAPMFVAHLDLCYPTPPGGLGLFRGSSYERLRSDLVMALAVSHHLAFRSKVPFYTFASIVERYARKYILTEYVDLEDVHVRKWIEKGRTPPRGYSEPEFAAAFENLGWRAAKRWPDHDGRRILFLFENDRNQRPASLPEF